MVGDTVFTINAKTRTVDRWTCAGMFHGLYQGKNELLCELKNGKKWVILPYRCVFTTEKEATDRMTSN